LKLTNEFSDRKGEILFFLDHYKYLSGKILDIGCGTGNMAEYYPDYTGISTNPTEVDAGKQRGRNIILCDSHDLLYHFKVNSFDGFIMWDSLEHFYSPLLALHNAEMILKEGGRGLIFMPGQNWLDCKDHIHVMTKPQMLHLINKVGKLEVTCYPKRYEDPTIYCEGMAVYEVRKNSEKEQVFKLWG
jgi:SAM-dependent methyltransferase